MQKQIERWIGGLTREQKALLKDWSQAFIPVNKDVLMYRLKWPILRTVLRRK